MDHLRQSVMTIDEHQPARPAGHLRAGLAALALVLAILLLASGCGGKVIAPPVNNTPIFENFDTTQGELPSRDWERQVYYSRALTLMSNDERMMYFRQESDTKRDLYLRSIGADARVDLEYRLKPLVGKPLDLPRVRQLFRDEVWDDDPVRYSLNEVWAVRRFNGLGYTHMLLTLSDGVLVSTASYSEQQWIENEQIYAECSRIENELGKILHKKMPITAIPKLVHQFSTSAAQIFAEVLNQGLERTDESWKIRQRIAEYKQQLRPYLFIADREFPEADMTQPIEYFALKFRDPLEERFEGTRTVWKWQVPFGDRRIDLVMEFRDRELHSWYCEPAPRTASN